MVNWVGLCAKQAIDGLFSLSLPSLFPPIFARETACQNCCIFSLLLRCWPEQVILYLLAAGLENRTLNLNIVWSQIWFRASITRPAESPAASPSKHTFPWHKTFFKPRASSSFFYVRVTTFFQTKLSTLFNNQFLNLTSCNQSTKYNEANCYIELLSQVCRAVSEIYKSPYLLHGVWKSQTKSHSTLRAKRAMLTFWINKSKFKMPTIVYFGEFLKIWSLRSNSVTKQVTFNRTKIGGTCQN